MAHTKKSIAGNVNNGSVNTFSYSGSFDVFKASEVEVELDNVALTFTTGTINESANPREYTVDFTNKTVHIGGADLASTDQVVIQPVTDMGSPTPRATYTPGASVTSSDLNNNQLQLLRKAMEYDEQKLSSRGGTMTGNLHMGEDVNLSFEGATDNNFETTITVADPTSDKTITFPDTTGTVITTGDSQTITTSMIASNAINSDRLANDSVNSQHYVDGSIDTAHIGTAQVNADKLASDSVITAKIQNLAVTTGKIADDAVTADKLAHTSVTPGSYTAVDLTVDQQGRITAAASGTIAGSEIAADAIDGTKIADDSINSEHYVDGSIDHQHLANDVIDGDNIQDDVINSEHYAADSIDTEHYAPNSVDTTALAADAVTAAQLADNAVDSEHYVDGSIDTVHIAGAQVTDAKLASNSVVTSKITDGNVTTLKIADANVTLGKLHGDLKQTSISDSDTQLPTSGAVVDYVAAQLLPFGGFEAIATELAFPNTQPASGVIISISDAAGVAVSGTSSNTGRTVGGSTVTINNFPSSLTGETLASGVGLMVSSTGSSQTYNYHKILAAETDVKQLSADINDFQARYRVGTGSDLAGLANNTLDAGDLFFNTSTQKLLVYNSTNTAWEEAQSIGNFFISTLSPAFDGSTIDFTLSNAPTNAQQVILSINGVIQKPNAGSSRPSEGFSLNGNTLQLPSGTGPLSGTDYFVIVMGSTVNIGTPSDGTVDTDVLTSGAVTTAKIADQAVTLDKLLHGDGSSNGKFLRANNGADPSFETVNTDLVADTSPQLGGDLASNGNDVVFADSDKAIFGTGSDLQIYHTPDNSWIKELGPGSLNINTNRLNVANAADNEVMINAVEDGAVELYHNGNKKFETASGGVLATGDVDSTTGIFERTNNGTSQLEFNSTSTTKLKHLSNNQCKLEFIGSGNTFGGAIDAQTNSGYIRIKNGADEQAVTCHSNGAVALYHNNGVRFYTTGEGVDVGSIQFTGTRNTNIEHEIAKFAASGTQGDNYHDNHVVTIGQTNGNWLDGATGDSDTSFGLMWHYANSATGTRMLRAGIHYDHKSTEQFKIWSSYGSIAFYTDTANSGNDTAEQCNVKCAEFDGNGHFVPGANNARDLGTSSLRWRNVYTNDLHLSNEGHTNDVDSTWGDWTIQEGESDLFLKNNRSGKKYKFNLTEVS